MNLQTPKGWTNSPKCLAKLLKSPLTPATRETWLMLASMTKDGSFFDYRGMAGVAAEYGIPYSSFISRVQRLRAAGGLTGRPQTGKHDSSCQLVIPERLEDVF